ncbi:pentatricopeptide repeat-containing protein At1g60770-like [Tripterygium wilfordii]|uniref:pentatricopeptide repeat-containing protein At1g60770-like n=1 Tax=Tripterygium wilfordii TaxID=458696 RepID=UPI0018F803D4|nr:pentatricopeptide repeat-containing protein At1g60770-like [Tripterygium wilfordii]
MAFQQFGRTKSVAKRSKKYLEEALYVRLYKDGSSELSVRQQLNQFIKSNKRVYKWEVGDTLKKLRHRELYYPAFKIHLPKFPLFLSDYVSKMRGMNKTVSDQAIHLDLVAKAQGIDAAESYFIDLPETSKNHLTYGALFNCYCKELMTEKAEALMEKMKELNLGLTSMHYNSLMTLYTKIDQPEKIPAIIQEMRSEYVMPDSYTYNVWMRALAAVNDISGVEQVIEEMKRDGRVVGEFAADWTTYSNLASIYADASLFEKAENALKELEKKNAHQDLSVYQFLITLYGCTGNLLEVYRIWRSLRLAFRKTSNISYLNMIQALVNLKDLPGAEKCFREWESGCSTYDIRIANVLIGAYAQKGFLEKAEEMKERARRRGAKSNAKTWELFLDYHLKDGNFKLAVDCIANAISTGRGNGGKWVPSLGVIKTMMTHFEQEKDVDGAEGFLEILKKAVENLDAEVFESLIRTYAAAGRTSTMMHRRLKTEKVEVNEASKKLLEAICVE